MAAKVILVILILAAVLAACNWDWWNVTPGTVSEHVTLVAERTATAYEATALAGATAWAVQREAIEESEK